MTTDKKENIKNGVSNQWQTFSAIGKDRLNGIGPPPPPPLNRGLKWEVERVSDCWSGCGLSFRNRRPINKKRVGIISWKIIVLWSLRADIALLMNKALECCQNVDLVMKQQLQHCIPKKLIKLITVAKIKPQALPNMVVMKPKIFL